MADNPYLSSKSEENPYLQAAIQQEIDSRIIENLSRLMPTSSTACQGSYRSAFETLDFNNSLAEQAASKNPSKTEHSSAGVYRSPDEILQEEAIRQQQAQAQADQAAIQQEHLERSRTRQLESQARAFLKKLDTLDPLNSERMWFESFANSCASRLEAAIEFVKTVGF